MDDDEGSGVVHRRSLNRSRSSSVLHERPLQAPPNAALPPVPTPFAQSSTSPRSEKSSSEAPGASVRARKPESSKASLTEALSKAQVAVQMDMSGDVQGAVEAYTTSVELLQQVMTRVEAGSAKDAARALPNDLPPEKLQRLQKRQQAREEEFKRLKVIVSRDRLQGRIQAPVDEPFSDGFCFEQHDTYLERITVLLESDMQLTSGRQPQESPERHPFAYDHPRHRQSSVSSAEGATPRPAAGFITPDSQPQDLPAHPRHSFVSTSSSTAPATTTRFSHYEVSPTTQKQYSPKSPARAYSDASHTSHSQADSTISSGTIYQRKQQQPLPSPSETASSSQSTTPWQQHRATQSISSLSSQRSSFEGLPVFNQSPIRELNGAPAARSNRSQAATPTLSSHRSVTNSPPPPSQSSSASVRTSGPPASSPGSSPLPPTPIEKEGPPIRTTRPRSLSQLGRKFSTSDGAPPQLPAIPVNYQIQRNQPPTLPIVTSFPPSQNSSTVDLESPLNPTSSSLSTQHSNASFSATSTPVYSRPPSIGPASSNISSNLPPLNRNLFQPVAPVRRPFQVLQRIRESILTGAYITQRLYVPKSVWAQAGIKLASLEHKQRMIEMLLQALDGVDKIGKPLLLVQPGENVRLAQTMGENMAKELEMFEQVLDHIEAGPAKKLSLTDGPGVKKGVRPQWW